MEGGNHHYTRFSGKGAQHFAHTVKIAFPAAQRQEPGPRLLLPHANPSRCSFGPFLVQSTRGPDVTLEPCSLPL